MDGWPNLLCQRETIYDVFVNKTLLESDFLTLIETGGGLALAHILGNV